MSPACWEIGARNGGGGRKPYPPSHWAMSWRTDPSWPWSKSFYDELTRPPGRAI